MRITAPQLGSTHITQRRQQQKNDGHFVRVEALEHFSLYLQTGIKKAKIEKLRKVEHVRRSIKENKT